MFTNYVPLIMRAYIVAYSEPDLTFRAAFVCQIGQKRLVGHVPAHTSYKTSGPHRPDSVLAQILR
jgi:hypothetical protein